MKSKRPNWKSVKTISNRGKKLGRTCFLSPNALDLKTPLSSPPASGRRVRARAGSGLASVIGFRRLLAKIDDSGGGLAPRGAVTWCSGAGRVGEGLLGLGIFRSLLAATQSAPISGLGGEFRVGCNRGESVRFCLFVCVLLVQFEWSSMAIRWFLVCSASLSLLPPLASCSDSPTFVVKKSSLVLKGCSQRLRCLGGSRESLAVFESASCPCSHPGAAVLVLFLWRWCSWLSCVGFETSFSGCGDGYNPSFCRFRRRLKQVLARFGMRFKASCGVSYILALVAFARPCYSGDVKGTPGILGNEENLTFPRITLMVENGYRCRRISKNKLAECAGFSGWAKLVL
ncbi:hypothetical protein F2Q69_00042837 [Brassica cretica]|uniref:Uncharacterized protein n=1 Tax=Brassica cretica TaxID=69181 RepID=A0A8S9N8V0_BRACR|nr:hypothetical protein F2Q69_00042837 [Brassica cretica]